MSVLLIVVGALVAAAGVGMIGYGIPINEFSFGNTLIVAGTTAVVGGIIVVAIGVAVGHLQRLAEMLVARPSEQPSRPPEAFEPPSTARAAPAPNRIPFPPRSKPPAFEVSETIAAPPPSAAPSAKERSTPIAAPMLRNPDMPAAAVEQFEVHEYAAVSLSPEEPMAPPAPSELAVSVPPPPPPESTIAPPVAERRPEPPVAVEDEPLRSMPPLPPRTEQQSQSSYFDTMWPAESRPAKRAAIDEPNSEPLPTQSPAAAASGEPAAILKSGVVDGMGYTLYVDGSIEAELPNGTLRFASINELRDHLAKSA
jgi:hypothetical protein